MIEGSGGSYACHCPRCGGASQRDHGEPPQVCLVCRYDLPRDQVDLDRLRQWFANTMPVRRFDGSVK